MPLTINVICFLACMLHGCFAINCYFGGTMPNGIVYPDKQQNCSETVGTTSFKDKCFIVLIDDGKEKSIGRGCINSTDQRAEITYCGTSTSGDIKIKGCCCTNELCNADVSNCFPDYVTTTKTPNPTKSITTTTNSPNTTNTIKTTKVTNNNKNNGNDREPNQSCMQLPNLVITLLAIILSNIHFFMA